MTIRRRAPSAAAAEARNDRQAVRPFVTQLGEWQTRLAKLDAALGYRERRGDDVSDLLQAVQTLRKEITAGLAAYDSAVCGREASTIILATRDAHLRLLALLDAIR